MWLVNVLVNRNYPGVLRAIVSPQAGGCTIAELPAENDGMARFHASLQCGGSPHDWKVVRRIGVYESSETANLIADAFALGMALKI